MTITAATHQHRAYHRAPRTLRVIRADEIAAGINHIVLADPTGSPLAAYEPGSHVIVNAGEFRNAYSLVGDGVNPAEYAISVLRRDAGGGSEWIHEFLKPGVEVEIEGPRSLFAPQYDQKHSLLVAGGIGITPILSHARALARWGGTADILYAYRPGFAAHVEELRALADSEKIWVFEANNREQAREMLSQLFADQRLGTHAYACGPIEMLDSYIELGERAGWPVGRLHLERFEAPELDPGEPFAARVVSRGITVDVPSGVSLLDALNEAGVAVPSLCRQGVCGECQISVSAGQIEHRDLVLGNDEKAAGNTMLCCVSRGKDLEVDL